MIQPTFVIGTLVLNEMEWLPSLYEQHRNWHGLVKWVFVEAADLVYARTSPSLVTQPDGTLGKPFGLSTDGTTEFLEKLAREDDRVIHIKHGLTSHQDMRQGKCQARSRYLDVANELEPQFVVILDCDEFYTRSAQQCMFAREIKQCGWVVKQRHLWLPPSVSEGRDSSRRHFRLFSHEVIGGYWGVPHARLWRWRSGMVYTNDHNIPEGYGIPHPGNPTVECQHMGFSATIKARRAKHLYYVARGETQNRLHRTYVDCRSAWEVWKPGDELPHKAKVIPYEGAKPEVFQ